MGRVRRFLIGRMSCQLLHRETDAPGSGIAPIQVPAGTELFSENAPCRGFPLVLEGEALVKVPGKPEGY